MRSGNQRFSFGFVITLFILGCIVGFLSNYKDVFQETLSEFAEPDDRQAADVIINVPDPAPKQKAVALKQKVIAEHPLYAEVERLEREILARSLEQTAYDTVFQNWQTGKNTGNPQEYLQNQASLVIDSLNKTTKDLLARNAEDKELEKQTLLVRHETSLREKREKINREYYAKVAAAREVYLKDVDELRQRLQSLDVPARYSIKVDIGVTPRTSELMTEGGDNGETRQSILDDLAQRDFQWENELNEINLEREHRLVELESQEQERLEKELEELEARYRLQEETIKEQMAEAAQGVEVRRNNMSETFSHLESQTLTQNNLLISSYRQLQEKQLNDLIVRKDNLLRNIESECSQTLRLLAMRDGYEPGGLVETVPEGAVDITDMILDAHRKTE